MKRLLLPLFCLAGSAFAASEVELAVGNMVCASCANAVSEALGAHPQVETVRVDLGNDRVIIDGKDAELDAAAMAAIIEETGFPVSGRWTYAASTAEQIEALAARLPAGGLPSRPYLFQVFTDPTDGTLWIRALIARSHAAAWHENLSESELPAAVFAAPAAFAPGWPEDTGSFTVFDAENLFRAESVQIAIAPEETCILIRIPT